MPRMVVELAAMSGISVVGCSSRATTVVGELCSGDVVVFGGNELGTIELVLQSTTLFWLFLRKHHWLRDNIWELRRETVLVDLSLVERSAPHLSEGGRIFVG